MVLQAPAGCPARLAGAAVGRLHLAPSDPEVLAYERTSGSDRRVVLVNQGPAAAQVGLEGAWQVELATDGTSGPEALEVDAAVVLRPS